NITALTISASLAQIGEFAFIIAGLGVALQIMNEEAQDLVLAGALITIMLNPLIFVLVDRWQAKHTRKAEEQTDAGPLPGPSLDLSDHAIVIGFGSVGTELVKLLRGHDVPVIVIDDSGHHIDRAHAAGIPAIRGSAAADLVLKEARPERATIAILA